MALFYFEPISFCEGSDRKSTETAKPEQVFRPALVEPKYENADPSRSAQGNPIYVNDTRDTSGDYSSLKPRDATDTGEYSQLEGVYQEINDS
jgi:hypothetical protein